MRQLPFVWKMSGVIAFAAAALVFVALNRSGVTPTLASANPTATSSTAVNHPSLTFVASPSATSIPAAFAQADVPYYPQDQVTALPNPSNGLGSVITVTRAMPVTITDGNQTYVARTWATTVQSLLAEQNITLGDQDEITPTLASALAPNEQITIVRVAVTTLTQNQPIPFLTTNQNDPNLNKGLTQVSQTGHNGVEALLYQLRRENGVQVSQTLLSTSVVTAPVTQVVLIGTKPVITVGCAGYNSTVLAAAIKNNVDPNLLCTGLTIESNGHASDIGVHSGVTYYGLFQYTSSFWAQASGLAGYGGASWSDATAQINVTAWALAHGYSSRWFWA